MDERGRPACALNRALTYDARERGMFLNARAKACERELVNECASAHTAKEANKRRRGRRSEGKNSGYSVGRTFWIGANARARCALEALALETFRATVNRARAIEGERRGRDDARDVDDAMAAYDAERSGAEWWTQVIGDGDEIGWHWDKDYALEASEVNIHPQIGTVTYLCDYGAPTVIVNRSTDVHYVVRDGDAAVRGPITECAVSWPKFGKQIAFDGKYLHGAPMELATRLIPGETSNGKRVTFLVNIWLNYKPITAEPLSANELRAMKMRNVDEAAAWTTDDPQEFALENSPSSACELFEFSFKYAKRERTLALTLPSTFRDGVWCDGARRDGSRCALVKGRYVGELR